MSQGYDDLLYGLGSDDLDDFDFDVKDEVFVEPHEYDEYGEDDPFFNDALSSMPDPTAPVAFQTAAGRTIPQASSAALDKARRLLESATTLEDNQGAAERVPPSTCGSMTAGIPLSAHAFSDISPAAGLSRNTNAAEHAQDNTSKRRKLDCHEGAGPGLMSDRGSLNSMAAETCSTASLPDFPPDQPAQRLYPAFTTGGGRVVPPPSASAMARVAHIFDEPSIEMLETKPSSPPPVLPVFQTGRYRPVPPPSRRAMEQAARIFAEVDSEIVALSPERTTDAVIETDSQHAPRLSAKDLFKNEDMLLPSSSYQLASGSPASIRQVDRSQASAIFGEGSQAAEMTSSARQHGPDTRLEMTPGPTRHLAHQRGSSFRSPLLFRTPLRQTTNTFSTPTITLPRPKVQPIEIKADVKTPLARSSKSLITPAPGRKRQKAFVTPFKDPLAPRTPRNRVQAQTPKVAHDEPVFDLEKPLGRVHMRAARLKPGYNSVRELAEFGIPDEICTIDLSSAIHYQFIAQDATTFDSTAALRILLGDGCRLATAKWVDNHWSQILWKIAGQIRALPTLFEEKWTWTHVVEQLKYRYEREIGSAERPILRRVQEHDSSAAASMVLFVSAIKRADQQEPATAKVTATPPAIANAKPYLELSDGWYRINAEIDDCLVRAVERGRIKVGAKLALRGSKLGSAADGEDVLDALDKSHLIISGNSCNLARWDTRLGLHQPFVAGLSSLSVDGGVIAMIDIEVVKVFPLAFVNVDKLSMDDPWDEGEEHRRQDQWNEKYRSESRRLGQATRTRLAAKEELVDLLMSHARDVEDAEDPSPDNLDQDYEKLLTARNQAGVLSQMRDSKITSLATYASQRMQTEIQEANNEVEETLRSSVPPREVRDFRMVRVIDALQGNRERFRCGMLTVWEARGVEIKEGTRYRVTSLFPGRQGDWGIPKDVAGGALREIYLHTRRETRWQPVA